MERSIEYELRNIQDKSIDFMRGKEYNILCQNLDLY